MAAALAAGLQRSLGPRRPLRCGTGLRERWALPAAGGSLRLCSTRVRPEGINRSVVDRIIRVDHAGEYGANRIYAGQMAVLGRSSVGPVIQQMWNQEKDHLKKFSELMVTYRVRPTALLPLWNVAGFVLGAGSALLGKKGAMACTVAVEESISNHYNSQIRTLMIEDPEKYKELLQQHQIVQEPKLKCTSLFSSEDSHTTGMQSCNISIRKNLVIFLIMFVAIHCDTKVLGNYRRLILTLFSLLKCSSLNT